MKPLPRIGLGTWRMGESASRASQEVAVIHAAIEAGVRLIDTAEQYASGGSESLVGRALASPDLPVARSELCIVSKVLPSNASRRGTREACLRSLERLGIEQMDLYLLHWSGPHPLQETIEAFEGLRDEGLIVNWGVSNLDLGAMKRLRALPGGERCAVDQVCWSLLQRGIEWDLKPWLDEHGVQTMAYSPLDEGRLIRDSRMQSLAAELGMDAGTLALAWLARHPMTCQIPMTTSVERARSNAAAADVELDAKALARIDAVFPPPKKATPLHII